ncbi:hypothetical protein L195_g058221, partial [Trifolium pratense]
EAVINDDPNAQLIAGDAVNNDEPNAQIILGEAVINDDPNAQLIAGDAVNNDEPNAQIIPGEAGINDDPNAQIPADAQIIPALANVDLAVNDHVDGQIVHGNVVNNHVNNLGPIANVVPPNRPNQWTENEEQMLLTAVDQYEHIAVLTVRFEMIKNDPVFSVFFAHRSVEALLTRYRLMRRQNRAFLHVVALGNPPGGNGPNLD